MTLLHDVVAELRGMFLGDLRLSLTILGVVSVAALLARIPGLPHLAVGAFLLFGCLATLVAAVVRASRVERRT